MTTPPRWPQFFMALLLLGASSACVTVVPMQTASVVPKGAYRLGGSSTITGYCGVSLRAFTILTGSSRYLQDCNAVPLGYTVPELRLGARHGVAEGFDLGASLQAQAVVGRGYQAGLFVDGKKELWTRPLDDGRRQILSVGPGVGYTTLQITSQTPWTSVGVFDVALPVYFGHETQSFELVAGVKYVERFLFSQRVDGSPREVLADGDFGLSVGMFSRGPTKFGMEIGYQTGVGRPLGGLFNVSLGVTWDVGLPEKAAPPTAQVPPPPVPATSAPATPSPPPAPAGATPL
jgi:hypothetical protein